MSYKYYSVMRPVGIGTFPSNQRPVKITNYPEGRKEVIAADGRTLMAWGEIEYDQPLSQLEMNRYELKGDVEYPPYKVVGKWSDTDIQIIMIDNRFFALAGWDGEKFTKCWECKTNKKMKSEDTYTLKPVYRHETDAGQAEMEKMYDIEEGTDEWNVMNDYLNQVVSYAISEN